MRLMLIALIAMSAAACASAPQGTIAANPLVSLKPDAIASVHATYVRDDEPAPTQGDVIITCNDCRQQYHYVDCDVSSASGARFVELAAFAKPAKPDDLPGYPAYFFEIKLINDQPLDGYFFEDGMMVLGNSWKGNAGVHTYRLDEAALKSLLTLLGGSHAGWACEETTAESLMVLIVPAELLESH